jgi:hypothetical protein
VGFKNMSLCDKLVAEVHEVVYFSVENNNNASVLVVHGLRTVGEVDDGQPSESESYAVVVVFTAVVKSAGVRTAMDYSLCHFTDNILTAINYSCKTNKTAHKVCLSVLISVLLNHYTTKPRVNKYTKDKIFPFCG